MHVCSPRNRQVKWQFPSVRFRIHAYNKIGIHILGGGSLHTTKRCQSISCAVTHDDLIMHIFIKTQQHLYLHTHINSHGLLHGRRESPNRTQSLLTTRASTNCTQTHTQWREINFVGLLPAWKKVKHTHKHSHIVYSYVCNNCIS